MENSALTRQPRHVDETGLTEELLKELVLKHIHDAVIIDLPQLRNRLKLAGSILDAVLQKLRKDQRLQALSPRDQTSGVRYQLTSLGQADASNALLRSGYLGPAPISLDHYQKLMSAQSILSEAMSREQVQKAFQGVVIEARHLDVLGPALYSGKPLLVYGQPGTGKTFICKKMAQLLGGNIHVPYAIAVDREIIQYFDPLMHIPVTEERPNAGLEFDASTDQRLLYCKRPVAISAGELTMDRLELKYDQVARTSYAPIQMKANNGIYIIDDMGRQRMPPVELFNRWIVPMEEHKDYLTLMTGKHFSVPFDCVLIFSTNLHPTDLADEAFLRRLGYKIHFTPITESQFEQIWLDLANKRQASIETGVLESLFELFRNSGRDLLPCYPRDLMGIALDIGAYLNIKGVVSQKNILLAWNTYFVDLTEG